MITVKNATSDTTLEATYAIVVYTAKDAPGQHRGQQAFATVHAIDGDGPSRTLGAGVPIDRHTCMETLGSLIGSAPFEIIPHHALACGPGVIAWWSEPKSRGTWFDESSDLKGRSGNVPHPGLIFVASANSLFVAAIKGSKRPTADSEVYIPPFFNVWESGQVCLGNVDIPAKPDLSAIYIYEEKFFQSYWTHPNVQKGAVRYKRGLTGLWRDLLDKKHDKFPVDVLIKKGQSVKQFINHVVRNLDAST